MSTPLRLRAARLFDGIQLTDRPMTVEIVDGLVTRTLPDSGGLGLACTDLGDVTLMPGMIDVHVHLAFAAADRPGYGLPLAEAELSARIEANALCALRAGITTVRDLGDPDFAVVRAASSAWSGPTVVASGPPLTTPAGHCHFLGGVVQDRAAIAEAVKKLADRGASTVKVMCTGGTGTPGSDPVRPQFSESELCTIVNTAHDYGLRVTAHAHGTEGIGNAVRAGVDGLEHAKFWTQTGIEPDPVIIGEIAERGIWVCPTLGELPGAAPPPPAVAHRALAAASVVSQMHRSGVKLVAGSDAGITAAKPHNVLPYSIEAMAACGMTAVEALQAATSLASGACGLSSKGRVRPGADADLLAVAGNPVRDLAALRQVRKVWVAGREVAHGRKVDDY